eukprot:scaffold4285_cov109-Isochrysis_galbana.AAC.2
MPRLPSALGLRRGRAVRRHAASFALSSAGRAFRVLCCAVPCVVPVGGGVVRMGLADVSLRIRAIPHSL